MRERIRVEGKKKENSKKIQEDRVRKQKYYAKVTRREERKSKRKNGK